MSLKTITNHIIVIILALLACSVGFLSVIYGDWRKGWGNHGLAVFIYIAIWLGVVIHVIRGILTSRPLKDYFSFEKIEGKPSIVDKLNEDNM